MLNRTSLSRKLAAMVVVPIAGLVLFAMMDLSRRIVVWQEMTELERLSQVAMEANQLSGALHEERSLTAGSLTASGESTAELEFTYDRTDQRASSLRDLVAALGASEIDDELRTQLETALAAVDGLGTHRQEVASGELSTAAAVSFYNDVTRQLLPVVTKVSEASNNAEIKALLLSLGLLAELKEAADLERAALNVAFTSDQISAGLLQAVVETIARQDSLEQLFRATAPSEVVAIFEETTGGDVLEEVASMRLDAMDSVDLETIGVNPRRWWRASSVRIEAFAEQEKELATLTLSRAQDLRGQARRAAILGLLTVLLAVAGAIVLSTFVGRSVNRSLTEASDTIRETVAQISSSVQQLTASTGETAAAVTQTSTTVDELRQTSESAAKKAQATSSSAEESRGDSERAQEASERGVDAMQSIRGEVEGIAERIVELSEKNAQISDIVQNVNAIAEQSNLLAVNASIEAAKAGEHVRGFAVVAGEVKTLAERSKDATEQIRAILTEIQRSSNAAVMVTEQGVKRVDEGHNLIDELGQGIASLAVTIDENSDSAQQISLISSQQLAGIEQITEALRSVEQAASDNAAGAQQLEKAAKSLEAVSDRISNIVQGENA